MKPAYRVLQSGDLSGIGDPVIVSTFMRSGTHLTIDLLRRQFDAFRSWKRPLEALDSLYLPVDVLLPGWEPADWSIPRVLEVLRRPRRPVLKTHFLDADLMNLRQSQPVVADWLDQRGTFLHVTRDLRQVLPSLWAFLPDWQGSDPVPFDEAFVREWAARAHEHAERWRARPGTRSIDYAEITGHPEALIRRLGDWLDEPPLLKLPLLPRPIKSRWESRLLRLFASQSESTAILSARRTQPWRPDWNSLLPPCLGSSN